MSRGGKGGPHINRSICKGEWLAWKLKIFIMSWWDSGVIVPICLCHGIEREREGQKEQKSYMREKLY
jgi:hypothetical protein